MRPAMKRPMQRTPTSNTLKTIPTALDPRTTKLSPRPGVFNLKQLMFSGEQMSSYRTSVCTFPLHSIYTLLPVWLVSATFLFCLYCLICLFLFVLLLSWSFVLILSGCVVSVSPFLLFWSRTSVLFITAYASTSVSIPSFVTASISVPIFICSLHKQLGN